MIKEFKNIEADDVMELEMIPKSPGTDARSAAVLSGIEVIAEAGGE